MIFESQPTAPESPSEPAGASKEYRRARSRRRRLGVVATAMLSAIALFALVGPLVIGHDPNHQDLANTLLPIWSEVEGKLHVLGTDGLGRDVLVRLAAGARASLSVALAGLVLGGGLGLVLGLAAGYWGGFIDNASMRLVDAQLSLPPMVFAMVVAAVAGVGFGSTVLALGLASWPTYARLIRAEVLQIKQQEFIASARMAGGSSYRILTRHVLPNVLGVLAVVGSLELGGIVLMESSLSFIGLGMQPPDASWGSMVGAGQSYIFTEWWISAIPAAFITFTVLGMNLLGDWCRDMLDPRSK